MPIGHLQSWLTKVYLLITSSTWITSIPAQNKKCCSVRACEHWRQKRMALSERCAPLGSKLGAKVTARYKNQTNWTAGIISGGFGFFFFSKAFLCTFKSLCSFTDIWRHIHIFTVPYLNDLFKLIITIKMSSARLTWQKFLSHASPT